MRCLEQTHGRNSVPLDKLMVMGVHYVNKDMVKDFKDRPFLRLRMKHPFMRHSRGAYRMYQKLWSNADIQMQSGAMSVVAGALADSLMVAPLAPPVSHKLSVRANGLMGCAGCRETNYAG